MISTVLFDFGNVLYWFDYNRFFTRVAPHSPHTPEQLQQLLFGGTDPIAHHYETGRMGSSEFLAWLRSTAGIDLPEPELRAAFVDIYTPNDAVLDLANCLADRMPIGLVSNTNEIHYQEYMRHTPIHSRFSAVGTSFQAGAMKPEAPIFRQVLEQLRCEPKQCVFVDDLEENVHAARSLGFAAIQYLESVDLRAALTGLGVGEGC